MDSPVVAVAIMLAGVLAALAGLVLTTRIARHVPGEADESTPMDIAFALTVAGIVAFIIGSALLGYTLFLQS